MITIQNADKALKDYYLEAVASQLNDNISPFYAAIEKSSANVYGKNAKIAVVRSNAGSVLAGSEDGDLPAPYTNRYLEISVPLKNLYGTIEISDKALRASRDSSGAFVNLVNAEMDGLIDSAKYNFRRMLLGDGTGKICKVLSKIDGKTYKVDKVTDDLLGLYVDAIPSVGSALKDSFGLTIVKIDKKQNTVTFNKDVLDPINTGYICLAGSSNNELSGLGAIFGGTELYGYKKADEPYMSPYIYDASNELSEDGIVEVIDKMEEERGSRINMIICSYLTRRRIAALIANNKRVVNTIDARTGVGVVTVNDVPVYADKFCPDDKIYFLNTDDFCLCQLCDWEWLEDEDGKILKQVPGKAAYGATLVKYAELVCKKPYGQAMMSRVNAIEGEVAGE